MNFPDRLEVSIDEQCLRVFEGAELLRFYKISTAAKGMGFVNGSHRTPVGNFRVAEKVGDNAPAGTIFKSRVSVGLWKGEESDEDLVLTRILWLEGMDAENANTMDRYIYVHGTNREDLLGRPASHGCIRMSNRDIIELFELVKPGTKMIIHPQRHTRGKLLFIDCDSTLSSIEGIDELAHAKGASVYAEVVALTNAAMNGEIPIREVFARRMEIIRPEKSICDVVAAKYVETLVPGALEFVTQMKADGWLPIILSGGFAPLIQPLATQLGIKYVEAVPLYFHDDGSYRGYGNDYPTTRNLGKNEVIREWKQALLPESVVMIGDGVSDLETKPDVDLFVAFTGVVARSKVVDGADQIASQFSSIRVK